MKKYLWNISFPESFDAALIRKLSLVPICFTFIILAGIGPHIFAGQYSVWSGITELIYSIDYCYIVFNILYRNLGREPYREIW